jgi:cytochrome c oxidase subunit 2
MVRQIDIRSYLIVAIFSLVYGSLRFSSTLASSRSLGNPNHVNPAELHVRGEFVESNLGAVLNADGSTTTRMIAERYLFVPARITLPAAVPVRLRITSADVPHAFRVAGVSVKVVPGVVTEAHLLLASPGEYEFQCEEFCGPGHHAMMARFIAVPKKDFQAANLSGSSLSQSGVARESR